jgi:hypothetical protein
LRQVPSLKVDEGSVLVLLPRREAGQETPFGELVEQSLNLL